MKILELFAGSKTGTQGLKGAYDRSQIPSQLFEEILK